METRITIIIIVIIVMVRIIMMIMIAVIFIIINNTKVVMNTDSRQNTLPGRFLYLY